MTKLPNTYQEVEYIQSSGTQYIDTGYDIQTGDTVEIKFNMLTYTGGSSGEQWIYSIWGNYNGYRAGVNHGLWETGDGFTYDTTGYDTDIITTGTSSYDFSYSGYLFAQNEEGSVAHLNQGTQRLFYCKISSGGILVRDFVPCYRKSDSVIGLYDLVNDQFYTNQGTGTFIKGANVTYTKYIDRYYLNGELYGIKFAEPGWQPGANTILYMPLTSQTTSYDQSSNQNDGTINGTVTFGTNLGVDCGAFLNSGYVTIPYDSSMSTTKITISCWCAIDSGYDSNNGGIIAKTSLVGSHGVYHIANLQNPGGNNFAFSIDADNGFALVNLFTGNRIWTHIVCTYDGTTLTVYKNGSLVKTDTYSYDISQDTSQLVLGAYYSSRYKMNGYLSNVILENKVRTAQEVSDYYNQTKSLYGIS